MIVFKTHDEEGETVQVNFCENGLFIQIGTDARHDNEMRNIIISEEDAKILIEYLNNNK